MARLGKSKSGTSTVLIVAAVVALVAGGIYFLFAPGEKTPQDVGVAAQTATPESLTSDSTAAPEGTGTPATEGGSSEGVNSNSALTPLAEATAVPDAGVSATPLPGATIAAPTPEAGTVSNGSIPESTPSTSNTPSSSNSSVSNSIPTPRSQPTGEVPIAEVTPLPPIRTTPAPSSNNPMATPSRGF